MELPDPEDVKRALDAVAEDIAKGPPPACPRCGCYMMTSLKLSNNGGEPERSHFCDHCPDPEPEPETAPEATEPEPTDLTGIGPWWRDREKSLILAHIGGLRDALASGEFEAYASKRLGGSNEAHGAVAKVATLIVDSIVLSVQRNRHRV